MNALGGVAAIDFDCKTAVLTMKEGAADLSQEAVTKAITDRGWGVKAWKAGLAELVDVHVFQLTGAKAEEHAALATRLQGEIKGAKQVVIDTSGRAVVTLAKDAELTAASLDASLKATRDGLAAKDLSSRRLPKTMTTYVVTVPGMADAALAAKVREALSALPKAVVVQVFEDRKSATLLLKEPCDKIAADVTAALKAKGLESSTAVAEAKSEKERDAQK